MSSNTAKEFSSPLVEEEGSIYSRILTDIACGTYVGGDRLITTKLAEQYHTSINPVREAIKQLQGEGFVTSSHNSGARVAKVEYQTMRNVFELLQTLEPYLISWFAQENTPAQRQRLNELIEQMEELDLEDYKKFRELDTLFHWETYRHHYNTCVLDIWRRQRLILTAVHANLPISKTRIQQSITEHKGMMEYLDNQDEEGLQELLKVHVFNSGQYWSRHISR